MKTEKWYLKQQQIDYLNMAGRSRTLLIKSTIAFPIYYQAYREWLADVRNLRIKHSL